MREALCACGNAFEVADDLAGGITNCPRCGKAVEVEGLRDPAWRVLQAAAAVAGAAATAGAWFAWGATGALATAALVAGLFWLLSRAL